MNYIDLVNPIPFITEAEAPHGPEPGGTISVPSQFPMVEPTFDLIANLYWIVPAFIGILGLVWRVFVWYKSRKKTD